MAEREAERYRRKQAEHGNRHARGFPDPLFTRVDADETIQQFKPVAYGRATEVLPGVTLTFRDAGHILGSASVWLQLEEEGSRSRIVFSGDIGQYDSPILRDPEGNGVADVVVMESTYGNRRHRERSDTLREFGEILRAARAGGGNVLVPAFAVGRSQEVLYELASHFDQWRVGDWHVFLDSPMALAGLTIYRAALADEAADVRAEFRGHENILDLPNLEEVVDTEGSKRVSRRNGSAVIIAGAGMASGGRVVHHLARFLPDARNSVALVGFQAEGTRGRQLLEGATSLKIHGQYVRVRAEMCDLTGFSVHADSDELMNWLETASREPSGVFVAHGELAASKALAERIERELDWTGVVPDLFERLSLAVPR